jgi:hypothetical protein
MSTMKRSSPERYKNYYSCLEISTLVIMTNRDEVSMYAFVPFWKEDTGVLIRVLSVQLKLEGALHNFSNKYCCFLLSQMLEDLPSQI